MAEELDRKKFLALMPVALIALVQTHKEPPTVILEQIHVTQNGNGPVTFSHCSVKSMLGQPGISIDSIERVELKPHPRLMAAVEEAAEE